LVFKNRSSKTRRGVVHVVNFIEQHLSIAALFKKRTSLFFEECKKVHVQGTVHSTPHRYSTTHVARVSPGGGEVTCTQVYTNASSSSCTTHITGRVVPHTHTQVFLKRTLYSIIEQRLHTNWCTHVCTNV